MYCKECGAQNEAGKTQCVSCGGALPQETAAGTTTMFQSPARQAVPAPVPATSGAAIASLVLGILGFLTIGLAGIVGLITGIVALRQIARSGGRLGGQGVATAGLITSGISVALIPLVAILAAILLPVFASARSKAQDVTCASNLKQIGMATEM